MNWVPANESFVQKSDDTTFGFFPSDQVTFTPEIGSEWYQFVEGSYPVPTNLGILTDLVAAQQSFTHKTFGKFQYANPTHNPPGADAFYGDTFLPELVVPSAIYIANTVA